MFYSRENNNMVEFAVEHTLTIITTKALKEAHEEKC